MKISIIIVNWNVELLLRQCLASIFVSQYAGEVEVIVVDSASSDDSVTMVEREFPAVKLISSTENLGFARGNNVGTHVATGNFILFLNPDTTLPVDALTRLEAYLIANASVGVVGPKLLYADGSVQPSRRRFPTAGSLFWESTLLEQWFPDNRHARSYKYAAEPDTMAMPVDWLVGAALFLRREVWEAVGPFDENLFMYFEETDWCHRCAEAGWQIHYLPQVEVIHYEGQSSQQVVAARTMRFQRSKIRYTQKWFGPRWAAAVRLFLLATFGLQWLEETLKWLIGRKRALHRERMTAYWQLLKSGLA